LLEGAAGHKKLLQHLPAHDYAAAKKRPMDPHLEKAKSTVGNMSMAKAKKAKNEADEVIESAGAIFGQDLHSYHI
jgi:hypothetical protein